MENREMPRKFRFVWKFTAAARSVHYDSTAFVLKIGKITAKSRLKYIYFLPSNSQFDSHCLHYKHQQPFKMLKLYVLRDVGIMF